MPWILTVSPRSLAAGGVEVTERATGERAVRSIEDVTAFLEGAGDDPGLSRPEASSRGGRAGPRGRPVRAPGGGGRRLARGDRARLAGAAQAAPPRRRGRHARRARARQADQRRPRLAERRGPAGALRRASARASGASRPARARTGVRHGRPPRAWPPQPRRPPGRCARPPVHAAGPRPRRAGAATRAVPGPGRAADARRAGPPRRRRAAADRVPGHDAAVPRRRRPKAAFADAEAAVAAGSRATDGPRSGFARGCSGSPPSWCSRRSSTTRWRSRSGAAPATGCCARGRRRIDQPRYGPNGAGVAAVRARVATHDRERGGGVGPRPRGVPGDDRPWPAVARPRRGRGAPDLRAARGAGRGGGARSDGLAPATAARARRLLARLGHVTALRHAFPLPCSRS